MTAIPTGFDIDSGCPDMADFTLCEASKRVVEDAGDAIRQQLQYDDTAVEVYRIAHRWRDSHVLPMWKIRHELRGRARRVQPTGAVTAARLKRMQSIRKKLQRTNYTLYQIQDIGGCRVIVDSMKEVRALTEMYKSDDIRHGIRREDNYIERPKVDGYRSQHLVLKFAGEGEDAAWNRHSIEVQIRTTLQHAWATAVEAVGLFEGQDIKGGEGSSAWRRLFALVSSEFALKEGGQFVPGTPEDRKERRREIRDLVARLDAIQALDGYREAINFAENIYAKQSRFFLIQYDYERRKVDVTAYSYIPDGLAGYVKEENVNGSLNSVLVEVDRVGDLKDAYPNYFLDVGIFTDELRQIVAPPHSTTFTGWKPDLSWFKGGKKL